MQPVVLKITILLSDSAYLLILPICHYENTIFLISVSDYHVYNNL